MATTSTNQNPAHLHSFEKKKGGGGGFGNLKPGGGMVSET